MAARFYPVDPAAVVRHELRVKQAYGGTYTYDNNGRVTWAINDKQKISGWYAYQYKVDPHWLIQVFNVSPEAVRITTWHTQLSTTKWTYTATNNLLFEAGVAAGASPDTIKTDLGSDRWPRHVPADAAARIVARRADGGNFNYRAPTELGLGTTGCPVADVQRLDELRDRLAQRQGRHGNAARPLLARRQQRLAPAASGTPSRRACRSSSRFSRRWPGGRTT